MALRTRRAMKGKGRVGEPTLRLPAKGYALDVDRRVPPPPPPFSLAINPLLVVPVDVRDVQNGKG